MSYEEDKFDNEFFTPASQDIPNNSVNPDNNFEDLLPLSIRDDFKLQPLKSKKRRASLPQRFQMNDRYSRIEYLEDKRTYLQKFQA